MWAKTRFTDLVGLDYPIIQAPMASFATAELAIAVSNSGGLGSLGCSRDTPQSLEALASEVRAGTNRPFNLNFFAHREPAPSAARCDQVARFLAPHYHEQGIEPVSAPVQSPIAPFGDEVLAALLRIQPAVVSFHFGLPQEAAVRALRDAGCLIVSSATTVTEAKALVANGVDAVVAQGWEAGGHRGAFSAEAEDVGVGTLALVPQIVDAVPVPVIAAGGIGDARGVAAAFMLGASAVQMGTAFLSCPEARVTDVHRRAIAGARDDDTCLSRGFSGRPARVKANHYTRLMAEYESELPDYPLMYPFSAPLVQRSAERGEEDWNCLFYGQAASLNRALPAAQLMNLLIQETDALFAGVSKLRQTELAC